LGWEGKSLLRYGLTLKSSVIYKQNCEGVCGRRRLFKESEKKSKEWEFDGVEINYMRN
jgi:hypothetical protein